MSDYKKFALLINALLINIFFNKQKGVSTMKHISKFFAIIIVAFFLLTGSSFAQDAVKVDPKHYKVEFENDQVRVLRVNYGPGEKSVMHEHPNAVAVFLSDGQNKFTMPDGKSQDAKFTAGMTMWTPAGKHLPENTGKKSFEVLVVELKSPKK
ncbi:MAG: cupin domain-containing protein [Ignavibacteriales bacterium]|nr:MAG: cupin domain-containing protein [Ignavibacteriales bacterium]